MRYIIGIDLGTTNSCVAYIDTYDPRASVNVFKIPQLIAEGSYESLASLPSFCYLSSAYEWSKGTLDLPWSTQSDFFVGSFAQTQGSKVPTRLVQSAKSWLCHSAADRRDKIIPVEAADHALRISPIEAAGRYLRHIKEAWNYSMAKGKLEAEFDAQEIVLTVPASFDEIARMLTVEAAKVAGYEKMTLLEEPQAAFYSWIAQYEDSWEKMIPTGSCILVCDVGGGTTDFSLIEVVSKEEKPAFQRMAVGNHLLLGGDNMDASVAHHLELKLGTAGHALSSTQRLQLLHEARKAKEILCGQPLANKGNEPGMHTLLLQGSGSSVIHGTLAVDITKEELQTLLYKGFFGQYDWEDAVQLKKSSGFRTMGLPYEKDPSIIKHLAHFLKESAGNDHIPKKPDFILFNGGVMKPRLFQDAIVDNLKNWFPEKTASILPSFNLDTAVSRGAAYFGKARRGIGVRIGGGIARGYYLVLDVGDTPGGMTSKKALTLLPRGCDEGSTYEPASIFLLLPNVPVSFQLCTSHTRFHDASGDLVDLNPEEMQMLPAIHTLLRFGRGQAFEASKEAIEVHLQIALTSIGTLQIGLKSLKTEHVWALEFQIRTALGQDDSLAALNKRTSDQTFSSGYLKEAESILGSIFGEVKGKHSPESLMDKLEESLSMQRREWPPSLMRGVADAALRLAAYRKNSANHEARWWNLIGFTLRPGFGYPLDDFRIKELWKIILSDFKSINVQDVLIQMWICYRRVAGGLSKGQQMQLAMDLLAALPLKKSGKIEFKSKSEIYPYSERIRAMAAWELIDIPLKIRLGHALVSRIISGEGTAAEEWSLGRLGARHLLYGTLINVIPREICEQWVVQLVNSSFKPDEKMAFLFGQLARKTEHPDINLSEKVVEKILNLFSGTMHFKRLNELLTQENRLSLQERDQTFGDHLPTGLLLII